MNTTGFRLLTSWSAVLLLTAALALPATAQNAPAGAAPAKEAPKATAPAEGEGWDFEIVPTGRIWGISGDNRRFSEDFQEASYKAGLDESKFSFKNKDGALLRGTERFLFPGDMGLDVRMQQEDKGYFHFQYDTHEHYFDDFVFAIHPVWRVLPGQAAVTRIPITLASRDSVKDDLKENIGKLNAEVGLTLTGLPKVVLGYTHDTRTGDQSLRVPSNVEFGGGEWSRYPTWQDIDYTSDKVYGEISHNLFGFNVALSPSYEIFTGEREYTTSFFANDAGIAPFLYVLNRRRTENHYDSRIFNGSLHIQGDLIKDQLHLDTKYTYQTRDNDNNVESRGIAAFDGPLAEKALNYLDNTHNSADYLHRFDLTLTYTGWDMAQPWVGFQYRNGHQQNHAVRREDGSDEVDVNGSPFLPDESWNLLTTNDEEGWAESLGIEFRGLDKTKIIAKGEFEQIDVEYDWSADMSYLYDWTNAANLALLGLAPGALAPTDGDWAWKDTGHYDKYTASLQWNNKSIDDVTISGRYKYTIRMTTHDKHLDVAFDKPGDPDYAPGSVFLSPNPAYQPANRTSFFYPGTIGDSDLSTHDVHLKVEWKACDWLVVTPRFEYRRDEYDREKDPNDHIGMMQRYVYGIETTTLPLDGLVFKNDYHFVDASTWSRAQSETNTLLLVSDGGTYRGAIAPRATMDAQVLDSDLAYTIDDWTFRTHYQYLTSNFEIHTYRHYGTLGAEYKVNDKFTVEGTFGYVGYWEQQNEGINDYEGPMGMITLKGRF